MNKTKSVDQSNIQDIQRTFNIDSTLILQKESYVSFLKNLYNDTLFIKNHMQPLQAIYFVNNKMVSFHLNCNAGGFPNLNWNVNNSLSVYPPKTQTPINDKFNLENFLNLMGAKNKSSDIVLLFWNNFLGKQTARFLNEFRQNIQIQKNVTVYFINNDNLFY